jgi:WXG100 family type VII secretion target
MTVKMTPEQSDKLAQAIDEARSSAGTIVGKIYSAHADVVGASWQGGAANAALSNADGFQQEWSRLGRILDDLQSGVVGSKNLLTNQDDDDRSRINSIPTDGVNMNFGRLA